MLIKSGVDISRLNREIRRTLNIVAQEYGKENEEAVITSTYEGNHSPSSLHYTNDAIDIRAVLNDKHTKIYKGIKERLGNGYDVVREADHIHIEYDPK